MVENEKYDVFISYSRADYLDEQNNVIVGSEVNAIIEALDKCGISYWIDIHKDSSESEYMYKIARAINISDTVLFISSQNSNHIESYWPIKEVLYASENKKRIIPIKIDNTQYNKKIGLAFAGLEMVEYYKNKDLAIKKMVKMLAHDAEVQTDPDNTTFVDKLKSITTVGLVGLLSCFLFLCVFFLAGFCYGYFSNRENVEVTMKDALREGKIEALDKHIVCYKGENLSFIYNISTNEITSIGEGKQNFWDRISVPNVIASASISYAFNKMTYNARFMSNGKSKFFFCVIGTIGILCGFTSGQQVGEGLATYQNDKALEEYFKDGSNRQTFQERANRIYRE